MNSTMVHMAKMMVPQLMQKSFRMILIIGCTLLNGCLSEQRTDADIIQKYWSAEKQVEMAYDNTDTVSLRNLNIFAVCNKKFADQHKQLPLNISCMAPDSTKEVFEWKLDLYSAEERASATQTELKQTFIQNATLSQEGTYRFNISLDSSTSIKGVHAIGVEIETVKDGKR